MGSVSMTLPQGLCVLAILVSPAFSQETQRGSKARFDRILQQFGFNQERQGGWQETKGRRNFVAEIAGPKLVVPQTSTGPKLSIPQTFPSPKLEDPQTLAGQDLLKRLQDEAIDKTRPAPQKGNNP